MPAPLPGELPRAADAHAFADASDDVVASAGGPPLITRHLLRPSAKWRRPGSRRRLEAVDFAAGLAELKK
jgi:hypothetical protein